MIYCIEKKNVSPSFGNFLPQQLIKAQFLAGIESFLAQKHWYLASLSSVIKHVSKKPRVARKFFDFRPTKSDFPKNAPPFEKYRHTISLLEFLDTPLMGSLALECPLLPRPGLVISHTTTTKRVEGGGLQELLLYIDHFCRTFLIFTCTLTWSIR